MIISADIIHTEINVRAFTRKIDRFKNRLEKFIYCDPKSAGRYTGDQNTDKVQYSTGYRFDRKAMQTKKWSRFKRYSFLSGLPVENGASFLEISHGTDQNSTKEVIEFINSLNNKFPNAIQTMEYMVMIASIIVNVDVTE